MTASSSTTLLDPSNAHNLQLATIQNTSNNRKQPNKMTTFTQKKSVRFAAEEELEQICTLDCSFTSCTSGEEFEQAKRNTILEGAKAKAQGLGELLEGTFSNAHDNAVQKRLNHYVAETDYRGVERFICESVYEERKSRRSDAIKAILIAQDMAEEKGMDLEETGEQLRKVALVYCVDAKVFARRMGKADEAAVYPKEHKTHRSHSSDKTCSSRSRRSARTCISSKRSIRV